MAGRYNYDAHSTGVPEQKGDPGRVWTEMSRNRVAENATAAIQRATDRQWAATDADTAGNDRMRQGGSAPQSALSSATNTPRTDTFRNADAASMANFNAADPGVLSMAGQGWSSRGVPGAAGVTRFDREGQSPIYTNAPGDTSDWVRGGMRGNLSVVPSGGGTPSGGQRGGGSPGAAPASDSFAPGQMFRRTGNTGPSAPTRTVNRENDQAIQSALRQLSTPYRGAQNGQLTAAQINARNDLLGSIARGDQNWDTESMRRSSMLENTALSGQNQLANTALSGQNQLANTSMGGQYQLANTALAGENQRANTDLSSQWSMAERGLANAGAYNVANLQSDTRQQLAGLSEMYRALYNPETPEEDRIQIEMMIQDRLNGPQTFADGGVVPDYRSALGYAQGGMVRGAGYGQTPDAAAVLPEINEYREYAMGAQKLGLPAVPFEQFLSLRGGAQQVAGAAQEPMSFANGGFVHPRRALVEAQNTPQPYRGPTRGQPVYENPNIPERPGRAPIAADTVPLGSGMLNDARSALRGLANRPMNFADGGQIPDPRDVSGRMVVDADPNAPTDSIPAIVDESMPAKLDSGEFVIPTDVVQFFGTDKLNKMIAQARQGQ